MFFPLLYFLKNRISLSFSIFVALLFMLLLASFRWETGTDWVPYHDDFISPNVRHDFELGYVAYVNLIRWFTDSYTIFLIITTLIPLIIIYTTLNKCVDNKKTVILSLAYFYSYYYLGSFFGAERRIIAIGLCFAAIGYLIKSKKVIAFIYISIAALFHSSAAIAILMFLVHKVKLKYLIGMMLLLTVIVIPFSAYMGSILSTIILYVPIDIVKYKLTVYTQDAGNYGAFNPVGLIKRVVICLIISLCILRTYLKYDKELMILLKIYLLGVILYIALTPISAMFSVLTIYFTIAEVLLIPIILVKLKVIENAPFIILVYIVYLCYQTYSILNSYPDLFYPYINIFSEINREGIY